jgi:hypothetical protein
MIEHMFEPTGTVASTREYQPQWDGSVWVDRPPLPGEPGYADHQAYLAYEDQQIAFWNAYSASAAAPEGVLPNLNGARTDAGLLGEIGRATEAVNAAEGRRLRGIADYVNRQIANPIVGYDERMMAHSAEAEIALELHVPPTTASRWIHLALTLTRRLPKTLAALEAGELSKAAAEMIADETENLNVAQCARLEDTVLPDAGARSYRSLRNKVRRTVEKLDADAVRKRAEKAVEERCAYVKDEPHGMATLCIYGPAGVVRSLYDALNDRVLTAQASRANSGVKDERRVGAQRHDAIVDILGTGLGIDPWAPPVPEPSFLTEEQITELDKRAGTYAPSAAMKRAVRLRDDHCRFPGCRRPARHCDIDHSIAFVKVGGKLVGPGTVYFNLGCVCRFHHQVKQMPGWHLEQDRGRFIWTAPNGMRFIVHPPPDGDDDEAPDFARITNPADDIPPF